MSRVLARAKTAENGKNSSLDPTSGNKCILYLINGDKGSNIFILDAQSLRTKLETENMVLREKTENLRRLESDYEMLEKRLDKEKHALEDAISCKDQEILLLKVVRS